MKLRALCALAAFLCFAPAAQATGLTVFVVNQSTTLSDAQIADALPVFQDAVSHEFAHAWGTDANLFFVPTSQVGNVPVGAWRVTFVDNPACGCYGYHGLAAAPFAIVGVDDWQVTFSHELFEMLADPWLNRLAIGTRLWLVEVADPVEDDAYAYQRLSPSGETVSVSDFVYPSWYAGKRAKRPYDYVGAVAKPEQLLSNGYVSYWTRGGWQQLFGRTRGATP